jgi:hypothetical protein
VSPCSFLRRPLWQLSIYPDPDPEIVLEEVHSDLERNIGIARAHVVMAYDTSKANVHGVVDKWINVEEKVERECPEDDVYLVYANRIYCVDIVHMETPHWNYRSY